MFASRTDYVCKCHFPYLMGCDRAIPKILSDGIALVDGSERERMGLPARGAFGEMVDMFTTAMFTLRKPLHDPSYANQDPVDNDL